MPTHFVWFPGRRGQRRADGLAHHNLSILVLKAQKAGILEDEGGHPAHCLGLNTAHLSSSKIPISPGNNGFAAAMLGATEAFWGSWVSFAWFLWFFVIFSTP